MSDAIILERAPPRRRDAQATRTALLEAAKAQFAALGYDSATLRDIAAAAGADVALIKRYFGGKAALFSSCELGAGSGFSTTNVTFTVGAAALVNEKLTPP